MNPLPIGAFNPGPMTGDGNVTWLIPGRVPTLVDAGVGDPRHLDAVNEALAGAALTQVLITHAHSDHASGAPSIATRMPGVTFRKMPWPERDMTWRVPFTPIADGDTIPAGDTVLEAVHTPGHAPDHLCFWHESSGTVFCGDLAIQGTTVFVPAAPHGDLTAYLASLHRILDLEPRRLLPAHGPAIDDPAALLRHYLKHRQNRETQILEALHSGLDGVDQIVDRIYPHLSPTLVARARETATAHLQKLERERRVVRDADAWHIMDA